MKWFFMFSYKIEHSLLIIKLIKIVYIIYINTNLIFIHLQIYFNKFLYIYFCIYNILFAKKYPWIIVDSSYYILYNINYKLLFTYRIQICKFTHIISKYIIFITFHFYSWYFIIWKVNIYLKRIFVLIFSIKIF